MKSRNDDNFRYFPKDAKGNVIPSRDYFVTAKGELIPKEASIHKQTMHLFVPRLYCKVGLEG